MKTELLSSCKYDSEIKVFTFQFFQNCILKKMCFVILVHPGERLSGMAGQCETSSIQMKIEVSEKVSNSFNLSC